MQLSPGVEINEIDLTIVVPTLGNSTAAFAGVFTKGPSDKYLRTTNVEELIENYGLPTNENYNDWYQAYNYLQYSNKLLISRAVDANGTFTNTKNTISSNSVLGKVTINTIGTNIQKGSKVKFATDAEDEYTVLSIDTEAGAIAQVDTLTINTVQDNIVFSVKNNNQEVSVISNTSVDNDTINSIANELASLLTTLDTNNTLISVQENVITITSTIPGTAMNNIVVSGDMTLATLTENVISAENELTFKEVNAVPFDFSTVASVGAEVLLKGSALNAIGTVQKEGTISQTAEDLTLETLFVSNSEEYDIIESSIEMNLNTKLKFIAKSSGSLMNGIQIAIARESDFSTGTKTAFKGIRLNSQFETKPLEANKEVAILIKEDDKVKETYICSLIPGSKDYRNKSNYIEDIINTYSNIVYVKDNQGVNELPESRLYISAVIDASNAVISNSEDKLIRLSNGSDGEVNFGDIERAYGSVSENSIFGNKEEIDIDIIIANELNRVVAGKLAHERADCIAFIGSKFSDVVGLKSTSIIENLITDVTTGELNSSSVTNSFSATFANYKYQYDRFNDKMRSNIGFAA